MKTLFSPDGGPKIREILDQLNPPADPEATRRGFSVNLGDGSRWWITSSESVFFIAKKLATIMQLEEKPGGEGDPQNARLIYFYEKNADQSKMESLFSKDHNWSRFDHLFFPIRYHPKLHYIFCEYDSIHPNSSPYISMWDAVQVIHWKNICQGGLPFHAALLEYQGQRVILAAPGETGKSTCSRRVVFPWQACCDDEVLVVQGPPGRYLAHPFPTWTDYLLERAPNTWEVEKALPLAGIFFFEQSAQDECVPLEGAQAAAAATYSAQQTMTRFLRWCGATEAQKVRWIMFDNACTLVRQVPTFHLRVSLHGRFWEKIEAALGWR